MLVVHTALHGYTIQAQDGPIGTVTDFLFDDRSWQCRWLVIDTGDWLSDRKVLLHPSAIGEADHNYKRFSTNLTRQKVQDGPRLIDYAPVSQQFEVSQFKYYGWDPFWGTGLYGLSGAGEFAGPARYFGGPILAELSDMPRHSSDADPHLRSMAELSGYHLHATDGDIGHVENMLVDDASLGVRYLIVDASNWWFGKRVLMSPSAITGISYDEEKIAVNVTRERVKDSPPWEPAELISQEIQKHLHSYYGWPGYGW
ncbi:MAG: PRC-barrel domain-containing protein [Ancalomicrobiaceae bacterium]|nr:PRC-barrel domain-containing protein [Ancalomicrobiaceae bacterium]